MKKIFTKKEPERKLIFSSKKRAGRGASGRITVRHRGGGAKRLHRIVDFGQEKLGIPGKISSFEYDPDRGAFISLIEYQDGDKRYILAPQGLKIGDEINCQDSAEIKIGNRTQLKNIPIGTQIHNIELEKGKGGRMVRGAGTAAKVLAQEAPYTSLELPSKENRKVSQECFASIGQVSNPEKKFEIIGKAGRRVLKGWRPNVRGSAMNPPDHPHGGGGGKTPIGMKYAKTPWGKHAFGVKTRKKKWTDKLIIKRRTK